MDAKTRSFTDVRAAMQRYVDQEILPGVSWTVLRGRDVVDQQCVGFADREAKTALKPERICVGVANGPSRSCGVPRRSDAWMSSASAWLIWLCVGAVPALSPACVTAPTFPDEAV